ncbi:MAG: S9 family peptidase, partial [Proteobacteria bacterium]|nr:S9 family peptidase [Pseudomonadota bacterium]
MKQEQRPYGAWRSPVSAAGVAGKSLRFGALQADSGALYWSESRPDESGRGVVMRVRPGGAPEEILPAPTSARSRVHEYGGGEFLAHGGQVYFVEAETQDIHVIGAQATPRRLTHEDDTRFADMTFDARQSRLIAVAERHGTGQLPENFLAAIPLGEGESRNIAKLATGADFYCSPRVSPDGGTLAWLAWDLPHMPWERAALWVADIADDGTLAQHRLIAGGGDSAAFQPE